MFKTGQLVRGNHRANRYGVTREGCIVQVIRLLGVYEFYGQLIKPSPHCNPGDGIGECFPLNVAYFNLVKEERKRNLPEWW